jgi:hypothetical protein
MDDAMLLLLLFSLLIFSIGESNIDEFHVFVAFSISKTSLKCKTTTPCCVVAILQMYFTEIIANTILWARN